ncbi:valine--tRNA ligase [Arthrobacter sp. TES]|uniref:Valine--tRNA ligase n=1 Tax=Paenarthrobacter ureafaciens TaxID=37931 RepID=A0AAX3ECL2_PAEUR|nr:MULTISPECIES: valine--tRNA ligase [Paenarthrobacter]AMB40811.1 valine--tRNA ligase [Arthrobacter sp. ATCC 21022]AOY71139.1 valyl-tRNA synthetase [Arthrobacter sp. ZXY-2]ERI39693.1 valine--tRNA ligase [Arthrobacter sp. AK-YN10]NKR10907.1 valine--tRNA ligase [Arthrobacter sp. M5]NKR18501.1 valine--tRNA ligase [Arthrobacter sp. M6]OEH57144.1 valine--tRNA ligase [Arthrobacter sp. D2]OEH64587.1 valine--tRNA ligase [Arthrobacter sp. D4]QOI63037.1 valine--tRNA ligase [Arthrobacter sp. TES]
MAESTQGTDTPATAPINVPDKPALEGLEAALTQRWLAEGTYKFNPDTTREQVYSIDTPPPTASGSLHVGHMFSFTQTDVQARYMRMTGKNVFYPMGWDDNGLPTERRVQNYYGVRCDPAIPYNADYRPPAQPAKNQRDFDVVSRQNFIELCEELAVEDEKVFENLFQTLGLSVDWNLTYRTIDDTSRAVSQRAFLANLAAGDAYMAEAPTLWDVTFRTAVAQAELEDREVPGAYYRYPFFTEDGEKIFIETTRPELLAACAALVANPDDERYQPYFGKTVTSPLFDVELEVKAHPLAKADKGSGIAMVCTFGDLTDVTWWRELQLPTRAIMGRDGRIIAETPEWITTEAGKEAYAAIAGKTAFSAKEAVVELLKAADLLDGEPKKITHPVNFFEKGDKPLEVVTSRQWYIRNGGRDEDRRERLIARGQEINFHPSFMRSRYENWIAGLNGDWLVSRQRFFGVPIPVWYPLDAQGNPDYDNPVLPSDDILPVDPAADAAPGYDESQRDQPGGFTGDADVLDTWATSSLTPQIVGGWSRDEDLFSKVYPFDLRPQGHDIIRTWLFSSAVRADALQKSAPWKHAAISGWILDPDRKKMSKSKGNVVVPTDVLNEYGSDAVRYWAASAKLGADTAYEIAQMKIGRRLAIKLLNASKFVLNLGATENSVVSSDLSVLTNPLDRALLAQLADVVAQSTKAFDNYDYARALQITESFFWQFTDDYVELIKDRAYGAAGDAEQASVLAALATTLDSLLRLFAPFLPFATEEVWSWWRTGSVHRAAWPAALEIADGDTTMLGTVGLALSGIRKAKSEAKVKQRTEVLSASITANEMLIAQLKAGLGDLKAAANAQEISLQSGEGDLAVSDVVLAQPEEAPAT